MLDNTNFRRDVWLLGRDAAGLVGDESPPPLDPRRYLMKVKDLRAFAASVLLDSGSSLFEAALLLRHADKRTTERLDALWEAWVTVMRSRPVTAIPCPTAARLPLGRRPRG